MIVQSYAVVTPSPGIKRKESLNIHIVNYKRINLRVILGKQLLTALKSADTHLSYSWRSTNLAKEPVDDALTTWYSDVDSRPFSRRPRLFNDL
jgi:hypothetical protein